MVFVTGGTGLIGSHLLYKLVSEGKKIKALKRTSGNTSLVLKVFSYYTNEPEKAFSQIEWVTGDVLDYYRLEDLLSGIDEVYHCAAIVSFNPADRRKMIHNNVEGTANIVNASLINKVRKFCHVSSVSALGHNQDGLPTDEQTNWVPSRRVTAYSESKFFSEAEVWRGIEEGLEAVIVNPSIVLGPGNWASGSARLFKTVWDGLQYYTNGVTGFVDVIDVVNAMTMLMEEHNFETFKNQRYLLNAENWPYKKLFDTIAGSLNKPKPSKKASRLMLAIAWRSAFVYNLIAANPLPITRETAAAANSSSTYTGDKIGTLPGFQYLPISKSIQKTAEFMLRDMQMKQTG